MLRDKAIPKIILCAGLPRSGSTWVYNATMMLLRPFTPTLGLFSDTITDDIVSHANDDVSLVVKCHAPDRSLVALAKMLAAPVVVTVRDPRDCVVSLSQVFNLSFELSLFHLSKSAARLVEFYSPDDQLLVKYEDASERAKIVEHLASYLGVPAPPELITEIANELEFNAVKEKITNWEIEGVLDVGRPAEVWTEESHWHAHHCADGMVGKYVNSLSPNDVAAVENKLRRFFETFKYSSDTPPAIKSGDAIDFGGDGIRYAFEGFSYAEDWGVWTEQPVARIVLPLAKRARRLQLALTLMRGACLSVREDRASALMFVNHREVASIFDDADLPGDLLFVYAGPVNADRVEVEFRFQNLQSPKALSLSTDERLLGLGIRKLKIKYE